MPLNAAGLRFPYERVLLPRTKLAYVHLDNLLNDAKRDRAARVFGYVAIWLPEELILLYMQEGSLANATSFDGDHYVPIPITTALRAVPAEPEFGEICFHQADDEQLACMFHTQVTEPDPWPPELDTSDARQLFPYLMSTTFDGVVQLTLDDRFNYLIFRDGSVVRGFLSDGAQGPLSERVKRLFLVEGRRRTMRLSRWKVPPPLPAQTPPTLIQVYRDLTRELVHELRERGRESAPAIAEHARRTLLAQHPALEAFALGAEADDPVADSGTVTAAVGAWVTEFMWTAADHVNGSPELLLRDVTRERRHLLQSAGFYDALPWKVDW